LATLDRDVRLEWPFKVIRYVTYIFYGKQTRIVVARKPYKI